MNRLRQMEIFAVIVEQGSISCAADKLGLSKSVISQHLKSLESDLDLTLLKRTTRRQSLTEAGAKLYGHCRELSQIANDAWQQLEPLKTNAKGQIKITASHAIMECLVVPAISKLMAVYPELTPELISEDQHLDFMEHDIDLAIRIGSSVNSNLRQKRIGAFTDILCGNKAVDNLEQLKSKPYIANTWQGKQIRHLFKDPKGKEFSFEPNVACTANSFHSCIALVKAGVGIGLIPSFYLSQKHTGLTNLLPQMTLQENSIYALHPYTTQPVNVKVCIDAIERTLAEHQHLVG